MLQYFLRTFVYYRIYYYFFRNLLGNKCISSPTIKNKKVISMLFLYYKKYYRFKEIRHDWQVCSMFVMVMHKAEYKAISTGVSEGES